MSRRTPAGPAVAAAPLSRPAPPTRAATAVGVALVVAALVAACGSSPADVPVGTTRPSSAAGAATDPPGTSPTGAPERSVDPEATQPPEATEPPSASGAPGPSDAPTPSAATPAPTAGADGCSGSAENRDFFAAAAEAMSWDVYCAVLPPGWFVETGSYRLADGGRLDITYRGPGGERLELREGAYCAGSASDCAPRSREIGPAAFGDRQGLLVALGGSDADGFAVYVDAGAAPAWAVTGVGMDQAAFTAIAAALLRVTR